MDDCAERHISDSTRLEKCNNWSLSVSNDFKASERNARWCPNGSASKVSTRFLTFSVAAPHQKGPQRRCGTPIPNIERNTATNIWPRGANNAQQTHPTQNTSTKLSAQSMLAAHNKRTNKQANKRTHKQRNRQQQVKKVRQPNLSNQRKGTGEHRKLSKRVEAPDN